DPAANDDDGVNAGRRSPDPVRVVTAEDRKSARAEQFERGRFAVILTEDTGVCPFSWSELRTRLDDRLRELGPAELVGEVLRQGPQALPFHLGRRGVEHLFPADERGRRQERDGDGREREPG